jgi:hypothetical protein
MLLKLLQAVRLPGNLNTLQQLKNLTIQLYFNYAGLNIDTTTQVLPGAYAGFTLREREDSVFIANVDYESPAGMPV